MSRDWDESSWACGGGVAAKSLRRSTTSSPAAGSKKSPPPQIFPPANLRPKGYKRLRRDKWEAAFDSQGRPVGFRKLLKSIVSGGVDHSIRGEVWEFLLGCYSLNSTADSRHHIRQARRVRYKDLIRECQSMHSTVGTGVLAYTVGNRVMDVRVTSKNITRQDTKLGIEHMSLDSRLGVDAADQQQPKSPLVQKALATVVGINADFDLSEDFGSPRDMEGVGVSGPISEPLYDYAGLSDHADDDAESEASDFSFGNVDDIEDFPYLPTMDLFAEDRKKSIGKSHKRAAPRDKISIQEDSPGVAHLLAAGEQKHVIYQVPIKFDTEPADAVPVRTLDVLGTPFRDVALLNLEGGFQQSPKPTGSAAVSNFPAKRVPTEEQVAEWLWTLHKIVVDVVRTDRHLEFYGDTKNLARMSDILAVYAWIDTSTGYCQGMSDLLSPFLVLFEDDADAFWCFESLLRRVKQNFQMEGPVGVMKQLEALPKILELTDVQMSRHFVNVGAESFVFAFRMLLVLFRRELSFGEALYMWEMMWAADFDQFMASTNEGCTPEALLLRSPSMSLQERMKEDDHSPVGLRLHSRSPYGSPKEHGSDASGLILLAKSPFCGLRPSIWARPSRQKPLRAGPFWKSGDEELSVFCVAAILVINRAKLLKEIQSMDDAVKVFNDMQMKIRVHKCIKTALSLRKRYRSQVVKRPSLRRSTSLKL